MRTTVTLDPDVAQLVRRRMDERRVSFKEALNDLLRMSAAKGDSSGEFKTQTADLGRCRINLDRALAIAGELEDDELIRKMRSGS